ncbi:hypothetical protein PRIPAC_83023, partial [Pristionchus pacificus]|uniref:Uncharacterized protein n=1 Tax=Pristionchus pacificus TaxID=54126 RepID=A0A2A6BVC8_PRIPA
MLFVFAQITRLKSSRHAGPIYAERFMKNDLDRRVQHQLLTRKPYFQKISTVAASRTPENRVSQNPTFLTVPSTSGFVRFLRERAHKDISAMPTSTINSMEKHVKNMAPVLSIAQALPTEGQVEMRRHRAAVGSRRPSVRCNDSRGLRSPYRARRPHQPFQSAPPPPHGRAARQRDEPSIDVKPQVKREILDDVDILIVGEKRGQVVLGAADTHETAIREFSLGSSTSLAGSTPSLLMLVVLKAHPMRLDP